MRRAPAPYRWLLRLLPEHLREAHGPDMAAAFREELERARAVEGVRRLPGIAAVWVAGTWDVVKRAVYERLRGGAGGVAVAGGTATRGRGRVRPPLSTVVTDLRFAVRTFARRPGMALLSVMMLALGTAASGAVFTLVDGLFLRPLPFPDPDRLAYVDETAPRWGLEEVGVSYADFVVWREGQRAFEAIGLLDLTSYNLAGDDGVERVDGLAVTHDLDDVLGLEPVIGRGFTAEEDRPGAAPVVMLGYDLWRNRFGGDRAVLGRTIRVNAEPATVVGVLPPAGEFPGGVQLWTPMALDPTTNVESYSYSGVGRLRPGVTMAAAQADLRRAHAPVWEERDEERVVSPIVKPLRDRLAGEFRGVAVALSAAVGLVLLIACGNVASMLLARSLSRRRELGVRMALGAGEGRIARQLLAESLALSLVAAPLGLVLGFWLVTLLSASLPEGLPAWMVLEPSWRLALFGLGLVVATTLLFGWAPVLQSRRHAVRESLSEGGGRSGSSKGQRRTMNGLVVAEVTLAALLLVCGGLLLRAFLELRDVAPGYRTENVLQFRIALPEATYPDSASRVIFYRRLLDGLEALPDVLAAGAVSCPPLGCHTGGFFAAEGGLGWDPEDANPVVLYRVATPGYFEAVGIRASRGRLIEAGDARPGVRSVVVNETFARMFFPGVEDPVGRRVVMRGRELDERAWRVVGVAPDVRHYGVDRPMRPALYLDYALSPEPMVSVAVWTAVEPTALASVARDVVAGIDPELPLFSISTTGEAFRHSLAVRRAYSWAMTVFAAVALVLALGGIYGLLSYTVGQRAREIGIRLALGATRPSVIGLVLRHGLMLGALGLGLGFAAALAAGAALDDLLAGFTPRDPLTFALVAVVLGGAALVASWLPARRAVAIPPGEALREE